MQKILFNAETNAFLISYCTTEGTAIQVLKQTEGDRDEFLETETLAAVTELNEFITTLKAKYDK